MRCVRVVVVMDDLVGGEWMSKIRHLSALWNVLCSSLDKVILGNNTNRTLINKNLLWVPHIFGALFCKRQNKCARAPLPTKRTRKGDGIAECTLHLDSHGTTRKQIANWIEHRPPFYYRVRFDPVMRDVTVQHITYRFGVRLVRRMQRSGGEIRLPSNLTVLWEPVRTYEKLLCTKKFAY